MTSVSRFLLLPITEVVGFNGLTVDVDAAGPGISCCWTTVLSKRKELWPFMAAQTSISISRDLFDIFRANRAKHGINGLDPVFPHTRSKGCRSFLDHQAIGTSTAFRYVRHKVLSAIRLLLQVASLLGGDTESMHRLLSSYKAVQFLTVGAAATDFASRLCILSLGTKHVTQTNGGEQTSVLVFCRSLQSSGTSGV